MTEKNIKNFTCLETINIIDAMSVIDTNAHGIIFSVDKTGKLTGSLTDGDIRRWILKNGSLDTMISDVVFKNPKYIVCHNGDPVDREYIEKGLKNTDIRVFPVVDENRVVVDIYIVDKIQYGSRVGLEEIPVVIMAGGRGTRLQPYTKVLPKPLIPMGDIPIVERIMNRFHEYGAIEFYMTLNYKKEMIKAYFNDADHDYNLRYVEEDKPLGTAGSIRLIKDRFEKPVIVSNCDILINADHGEILDFHRNNKNKMTIVSSAKKITVPYGVLNTEEGGRVVSIEEKPNMSYFINTGMYVIDPDIIELIPKDTFFHMTDLTQVLLDKGMKVGTYPISEEAFLDMGELEEMKRMEEKLEARNE